MRKIRLDLCNTARLDNDETFVLPEKLEFEITSNTYKLNTLVITARNGDKKIKRKCTDNKTVDLSELAFAGRIELEISNVICGNVVKSWRVPDLLVKEIEHNFQVIPEIEALKSEFNDKLKTLEKAIAQLNIKLEQGV